jgi:hypothetical protein
MIRVACWIPAMAAATVLWYECAENPFVFCYRIGWGTYRSWRSGSFAPIFANMRAETACCNQSFTSSTLFTTPKG